MKLKLNVLLLFLLTAIISLAASTDDTEDTENMEDPDMDMDDTGDMYDDDFQDTDPDMMDPDMGDGTVMDDMESSDNMAEEEEPKVKRVRVSYAHIVGDKVYFYNALLCCSCIHFAYLLMHDWY